MPGACCTRGLVCNVHEEVRTRAYRYSRSTPAFPAQWFDGLCRALPGDEFLLPPSLPAWRLIDPVGSTSPPGTRRNMHRPLPPLTTFAGAQLRTSIPLEVNELLGLIDPVSHIATW